MTYLHTVFRLLGASGPMAVTIKSKAKEKFRTAVMLQI
jgi:hypothetical protein